MDIPKPKKLGMSAKYHCEIFKRLLEGETKQAISEHYGVTLPRLRQVIQKHQRVLLAFGRVHLHMTTKTPDIYHLLFNCAYGFIDTLDACVKDHWHKLNDQFVEYRE